MRREPMHRLHPTIIAASITLAAMLIASQANAQTAGAPPANPQTASPQTANPQTANPQTATTQTAAPPAATPQAVDPTLTMPGAQLKPEQVSGMQRKLADWPQLGRYREANAALGAPEPDRVVFYGDSITDSWHLDQSFPGKHYVNRGISGQTTPQMLVRFQQDVVALRPAAVVILAGTNDLAGNTGLSTLEMTEDNFKSMAALADSAHVKMIVSSTLPVDEYPWRPGLKPAEKVRDLNRWLRQFCTAHGYTYLDYYAALATSEGAMKPGTSSDGVHPTAAGYAVMTPLAQDAITRTLPAR